MRRRGQQYATRRRDGKVGKIFTWSVHRLAWRQKKKILPSPTINFFLSFLSSLPALLPTFFFSSSTHIFFLS